MVPAAIAAKVRRRLVVPTILFMLLSSVDRVNVSFAAAGMSRDLGFSPAEYGFGAGILFVGFLAGQFPSVLVMQRIGFRRWLAGCALVWGGAAALMATVHSHGAFYLLRVVLGLAEGGVAPGIVLYLSQFATERQRATTFAMPMLAIPLSIVIGAPLSGWLLAMSPPWGLASWQWMFLGEAVPTLVAGLVACLYFPDTPEDASWLDAGERRWLAENAANRRETARRNDWRVLARPFVWSSALLWFCLLAGSYGIIFWLPQVVRSLATLGSVTVGFVAAAPWAANAIGIYIGATSSDRTGERFWHVALPAAGVAGAILLAWALGATAGGLVVLCVTGLMLGATQGAFWALPTRLFTPATFAVGAVAINIVGSSGGLVVPWVIGIVREQSAGFAATTWLIAAFPAAGAVIALVLRAASRRHEPA